MLWHKRIIENKFLTAITFLSVVLVMISFYSGSVYLFSFSMTFILYSVASNWYLKHAANQLEIDYRRKKIKLFPHEDGTLQLKLQQYGKVPIMNSNLRLYIDNVIDCSPYSKETNKELLEVIIPISMAHREEVELSIPFTASKRGYAKIRSVDMTVQNPFGFGMAVLEYNHWIQHEIIIYPTPIAVSGIEQILPRRQGTYPNRHSLFEYQSSPTGTRSYVPSDPFNKIHWKASARTTQLQTKLFDKTSLFAWSIILDIRDGNGFITNLENMLSYITYICHVATTKKISFELFINIRSAGKTPFFHLPFGTGAEQLEKALEMLAKVNKNSVLITLERMLLSIEKHHSLAPFIITAGSFEAGKGMLERLLIKYDTIYHINDDGESAYISRLQKARTLSVKEG